jgi:MFS family permease
VRAGEVMAEQALGAAAPAARNSQTLVIAGASIGTLFEWYDFFLYGALASDIAKRFFTGVSETIGFVLALTAFGAGFAVRPLGALVFGRIGDVVGRKNTFLVTMVLMGASTFLVGVLPDFSLIGLAAPVLLVALRLMQGLAIGGEYGGAAIYVAEHAAADRRGLATSWINAMATMGLVLALLVIIACRLLLPADAFAVWGWRLPFLVSIVLLGVSLWIRMRLGESPVFQRMKDEGKLSKAPVAESFGSWANLKTVLLIVFGVVAGSTTIWYAAQFYALFFLERTLKLDGLTADALMALALAVSAPAYLLMGWLSDRIGRKPVMMTGAVLGALLMFPLFHLLTEAANPALAAAQRSAPVVVYADPAACSVQFDPLNRGHFNAPCDVAKAYLARAGVSYANAAAPAGEPVSVHIGRAAVSIPNAARLSASAVESVQAQLRGALDAAGYPAAADPARINMPAVVAIVVLLSVIAAMGYAPAAAFLVELFAARVRYTSFSVPYHLGVGWIGGFLPATAFAIVAATGDIYAGLWYPVGFAALTAIVGILLLPETRGRTI